MIAYNLSKYPNNYGSNHSESMCYCRVWQVAPGVADSWCYRESHFSRPSLSYPAVILRSVCVQNKHDG